MGSTHQLQSFETSTFNFSIRSLIIDLDGKSKRSSNLDGCFKGSNHTRLSHKHQTKHHSATLIFISPSLQRNPRWCIGVLNQSSVDFENPASRLNSPPSGYNEVPSGWSCSDMMSKRRDPTNTPMITTSREPIQISRPLYVVCYTHTYHDNYIDILRNDCLVGWMNLSDLPYLNDQRSFWLIDLSLVQLGRFALGSFERSLFLHILDVIKSP